MKTTKSILGILTITAALVVQLQAQPFLTNGLVAYYPFNGNANDVVGTNNGTVHGATLATDRFGVPNQAYHFDGVSNSIVMSDAAMPLGNAPRTISLWFNCQPNSPEVYAILFRYGVLARHEGCWINVFVGNDGTGRPVGSVLFDFYSQFGNESGLLSTTQVTLNNWTHLVCSFDNLSTAKIYINGLPAGSGSITVNTASSGSLIIGVLSDGLAPTLGEIDDVRVYNRALSSNEVAQLYAVESLPIVNIQKAVYLTVNNLYSGSNYQVQASSDLINWTNQGSVFTATNSNWQSTDYWNVSDWNELFFRVQLVP